VLSTATWLDYLNGVNLGPRVAWVVLARQVPYFQTITHGRRCIWRDTFTTYDAKTGKEIGGTYSVGSPKRATL